MSRYLANDEQTIYLADHALHFQSDEAYLLLVVLHEQFKGKQAHR